jgi:hypothetical protein
MVPIKLGDYTGFFRFSADDKRIFFTYVDGHGIRHVHWVESGKIFRRPRDDEDLYAFYPELSIIPISLEEIRNEGINASLIKEIIEDRERAKKFWV